MKPEYLAYRKRWMEEYRAGHRGCTVDHVEGLSGVDAVPGRVGLVNVAVELGRRGSVGGDGGEKWGGMVGGKREADVVAGREE